MSIKNCADAAGLPAIFIEGYWSEPPDPNTVNALGSWVPYPCGFCKGGDFLRDIPEFQVTPESKPPTLSAAEDKGWDAR
jgi:hypothetical protein